MELGNNRLRRLPINGNRAIIQKPQAAQVPPNGAGKTACLGLCLNTKTRQLMRVERIASRCKTNREKLTVTYTFFWDIYVEQVSSIGLLLKRRPIHKGDGVFIIISPFILCEM